PNDDEHFKLSGQGIGSLGLHLKTRFIKTSRPPHVGLGLIASVYLPTTDPKGNWLGERKVVPQIIGIVDKELGSRGQLRIAANAGIRIRSTETFTDNDPGSNMAPITGQSVTVGNEIPFGLGIAYAIAVQKFDVVAEVLGSVPLGDNENYQPLEAIAGIK